jgi:MFS transporter, PAT family, beta-lactamase induction signal transducer AmpG
MAEAGARRPFLAGLLANRRVVAAMTTGFASGLPFNLPQGTLQSWLATTSVDLKTIGIFTLVAVPYSVKWLWAPLLDRYAPPFLGRRRGWIVCFQLLLAVAIGLLAMQRPPGNLDALFALSLAIVVLSASQDIVIDAYRTDLLRAEERGIGSTAVQLGWRAATYVSGAFALVIAGLVGWRATYLSMAALMALAALATVLAPEPERRVVPPNGLKEAVLLPLRELFGRPGVRTLLLLVVLYKLGDAFALSLWSAFLIKGAGFTPLEVGEVAKVLAIAATIAGTLAGGILFSRLGLYRSLVLFGVLQSLSNLLYAWLAAAGHDFPRMIIAVGFDYFAGGLGAAAFGAFLMALCDLRYSAFQFALLSSFGALGRSWLGPVAGALVEGAQVNLHLGSRAIAAVTLPALGWQNFFLLTTLTGLPAVLLLVAVRQRVRALDHDPAVRQD